MSVIEILITYRQGFSAALGVTLRLSVVIWCSGIIIGGLLGVISNRWPFVCGIPTRVLSFVLSGLPVLVLLFWFHYPLQAMFDVVIDPFYTAATVLSLVNVFAVSDLVRRALEDFPSQYLVAAKVCGLSTRQTVVRIQLPILLRQVLPGLLVLQVVMLQATLFASLISVDEIFRVAQRVNAQIYRPVQIYTALGLFFLMICLPLNGLAAWMRIRFTRDTSER